MLPNQKRPTAVIETLLVLSAFAIFCNRPSVLGEFITPVAAVIVFFSVLMTQLNGERLSMQVKGMNLAIGTLSSIFFVYMFIIYVLKSFAISIAVKNLAIHAAAVLPLLVNFSIPDYARKFRTTIFMIIACAGFSSFISLLILQFTSVDNIRLGEIPYRYGDERTSQIVFPLSVLYHIMNESTTSFGVTLYRFSCFFREAGICQAFAAWAMICLINARDKRWWIFLGVAASFVCSFSTSTLISSVFVCFALSRRFRLTMPARLFLGTTLASFVAYLIFYAPVIGYFSKENSALIESNSERAEPIWIAMTSGLETPFGTFSGDIYHPHVSICLLAETTVIGMVGVALCVSYYLIPLLFLSRRRIETLLAIAPLLTTALTSQPMGYAPLTIVAIALASREYDLE